MTINYCEVLGRTRGNSMEWITKQSKWQCWWRGKWNIENFDEMTR